MAHELDERLRGVELGQARSQQLITDHIKVVDRMLVRVNDTVYGTDANSGLVTRMDREEQNTKRTKRTFWLVASSFIGIGAKLTYDWIQVLFP